MKTLILKIWKLVKWSAIVSGCFVSFGVGFAMYSNDPNRDIPTVITTDMTPTQIETAEAHNAAIEHRRKLAVLKRAEEEESAARVAARSLVLQKELEEAKRAAAGRQAAIERAEAERAATREKRKVELAERAATEKLNPKPVVAPVVATPSNPRKLACGSDNEKAYAQSKAELIIKMQLKSPSSADFPFWDRPIVSAKFNDKTQKCVYTVSGYLDSQNSFGAMVRSDYVAFPIRAEGAWENGGVVLDTRK